MNVAVIPSRRGSTGLFNKNMRVLGGKTLLERAIEAAKEAKIDKVVVTSDDPEARKVAERLGVDFYELPESLGVDDSLEKAVLFAVKKTGLKPDYVCVLVPSSPLRIVEDITGTKACFKNGVQTACTVLIEKDSAFCRLRADKRDLLHQTPWFKTNWRERTDRATISEAVIWVEASYFTQTGHLIGPKVAGYPIPKYRALEIRDYWDFIVAEAYLNELKKRGDIVA